MEMRIAVGGLKELSRALKDVDTQAPKQLRLALNVAADYLAGKIRPEVPTLSGAARRSVKASSTRTAARVSVGGTRAAYFPWLDFGGQGRIAGRPAPRPFLADGRYVYPTLGRNRPEIERILQEAISDVITSAGLQES